MNERNKYFMKLTKFWKVVKMNRSRVAFLGGKVTGRRPPHGPEFSSGPCGGGVGRNV